MNSEVPVETAYYINQAGADSLRSTRGAWIPPEDRLKDLVLCMLNTEYSYTGKVGRTPLELRREYFVRLDLEKLIGALRDLQAGGFLDTVHRGDVVLPMVRAGQSFDYL